MSICYAITLYNKQDYIVPVLDAIAGEWSRTGGEIIIYDDASNDASLLLVKSHPLYAQGAIRLLENPENKGLIVATQALIDAATQPYLRLIDADDIINPGSTKNLLDWLTLHKCAMVFGQAETLTPDIKIRATHKLVNPKILTNPARFFLTSTPYNVSVALFDTHILKAQPPLPSQWRHAQDLLLVLRLLGKHSFGSIDNVCALLPQSSGNRLSRRMAEMYGQMCEITAHELPQNMPLSVWRFAVRRNARRAMHYFRREAKPLYSRALRRELMWHWFKSAVLSRSNAQKTLLRLAEIFAKDAARILQKAA